MFWLMLMTESQKQMLQIRYQETLKDATLSYVELSARALEEEKKTSSATRPVLLLTAIVCPFVFIFDFLFAFLMIA